MGLMHEDYSRAPEDVTNERYLSISAVFWYSQKRLGRNTPGLLSIHMSTSKLKELQLTAKKVNIKHIFS